MKTIWLASSVVALMGALASRPVLAVAASQSTTPTANAQGEDLEDDIPKLSPKEVKASHVYHPLRVTAQLTKDGCQASANNVTPENSDVAEQYAYSACLNALIPKRITPVVQTPGSYFLGWAWGATTPKSGTFVYGPQVGIGTALLLPLHRPYLIYTATNTEITPGNPPVPGATGTARTWTYAPPSSMTYASNLELSLNANLAAFQFPTATNSSTSASTQPGFNASAYIAPQFGWEWWEGGSPKSVMLSIGFMFGYINTVATGSGFAIGIQPGLVAQF